MRLSVLMTALCLLAAPRVARADLIYTYTGGPFIYTTGVYTPNFDRIIGAFVLSDDFFVPEPTGNILANVSASVLSYIFTDGHQILTPYNSSAEFRVGFDPVTRLPVVPGSIASFVGWWELAITGEHGGLTTVYINNEFASAAWMGDPVFDHAPSQMVINGEVDAAIYGGTPGTWTIQTVPEPATWALMALGVGLFVRRAHGFNAP